MQHIDTRTLLVVDDDPDIRTLISADVRDELGYAVVTAVDGDDALQTLKSRSVDAVLCDVNMPRMGGIELLTALRASGLDVPPFVFLTGYQSEELLLAAVQLGAVDFLSKPGTVEDLRRVVERALDIGARTRIVARLIEDIALAHPDTVPQLRELERHERAIRLLQAAGTARLRSAG